tara:strand:+ start:513 stop:884 length:372 start_codon:yes stop_codon:yes gene_type:complete
MKSTPMSIELLEMLSHNLDSAIDYLDISQSEGNKIRDDWDSYVGIFNINGVLLGHVVTKLSSEVVKREYNFFLQQREWGITSFIDYIVSSYTSSNAMNDLTIGERIYLQEKISSRLEKNNLLN